MIRLYITIIIFLSAALASWGIPNERIRLFISNDADQSFDRISVGIDQNATKGLDTALGEDELPPFPPPGPVLHGVCIIKKSPDENVWSYSDIQPIPADREKFYVKHRIDLQRGSGKTMWIRRSSIGSYIDSIKITDIITEDIFVRDMKDSVKITVENPDLNDFFLHIWYTKQPVSTKKANNIDEAQIFPVPAKNSITIKSAVNCFFYKIIDFTGKEVAEGNLSGLNTTVDVSGFATGIYNVVLYSGKGIEEIKKIIIE
jgi:hypothetical protein